MPNIWEDPTKYKKCRKKQYDIHVCRPPVGTVVINKLEQAQSLQIAGRQYFTDEELRKSKNSGNPVLWTKVLDLVQKGMAYVTTKESPYVLCGTVGELWCIKEDKLMKNYTFLQDGKALPMNAKSLEDRKNSNGYLDWTVVRTSPTSIAGTTMACFVPASIKGQVLGYGGSTWLAVNGPGCSHGKGDFVLCNMTPDGRPDFSDMWVVNGEIFATTYNNQGWSDCLDQHIASRAPITIAVLPKLCPEGSSVKVDENAQAVLDFLAREVDVLKKTCASQVKFDYRYNRELGVIECRPTVIESYKEGQGTRFKHLQVEIRVKDGKIVFKGWNVMRDGQKRPALDLELPANQAGCNEFKEKLPVYAGMLGWIPAGYENAFRMDYRPDKASYDGIHAYTVSSSGFARRLRYLQKDSEKGNIEELRLARSINGADMYLTLSKAVAPVPVFRGMPAQDILPLVEGASTVNELVGKTITNTSFSSTSLGFHPTLMFANPPGKNTTDGVIIYTVLPPGTQAAYIHSIAAWKEQFEVLLHRIYDTVITKKVCEFKCGGQRCHVFEANLVQHSPHGEIPAWMRENAAAQKLCDNPLYYDCNGMIDVSESLARGIMQEAFNELKGKGLSGVQFQSKKKLNLERTNKDSLAYAGDEREYIVVHAGTGDDNTVTDLMYSYLPADGNVGVFKVVSSGEGATARGYWSDQNRNGGAIDSNFTWDDYNHTSGVQKSFKMLPLIRKEGMTEANALAFTILEHVKYNKDVTLFPMQDVARYFDMVFKNTILNEGYELKDSMPVQRNGNPQNPDDGFVPLGYHIDGDDDDSLKIMMKMDRGENKRLQLKYRGSSKDGKVNNNDMLKWNIFNESIMQKECDKILYIFASQLNLNHTRKMDRLMAYIAYNRGFKLASSVAMKNFGESVKDKSIHEKGNFKMYALWLNTRRSIKVAVQHDKGQYLVAFRNDAGRQETCVLDAKQPIYEMYAIACQEIWKLIQGMQAGQTDQIAQ